MSFGPSPPQVQPLNTAGQDVNAAAAAAKAADEEKTKLNKQRGQAANVLGGANMPTETSGKPSLLSGLKA